MVQSERMVICKSSKQKSLLINPDEVWVDLEKLSEAIEGPS